MDWQAIGKHAARVEGDVVHVVWNGDVGLVETQQVFRLYAEVREREGRVFAISDMRHSGVPPAAVRRWIADWMSKQHRIEGAAAYGANILIRAAFVMLLRGIVLISKFPFPFDVFATENDARAFITRLRNELGAKRS